MYKLIYKDKAQYCPGEVCDIKQKHDIQKTSWMQIFVVLGMVGLIILVGFMFNDFFSIKPQDLFGNTGQ